MGYSSKRGTPKAGITSRTSRHLLLTKSSYNHLVPRFTFGESWSGIGQKSCGVKQKRKNVPTEIQRGEQKWDGGINGAVRGNQI